jgi:hypothetical protein
MVAVVHDRSLVPWPYRIRPAAPVDVETLRDVEQAAGRCFCEVGMSEIADEPPPVDVLSRYQLDGRALVACALERPVLRQVRLPRP